MIQGRKYVKPMGSMIDDTLDNIMLFFFFMNGVRSEISKKILQSDRPNKGNNSVLSLKNYDQPNDD
jgi:hypothetical protein